MTIRKRRILSWRTAIYIFVLVLSTFIVLGQLGVLDRYRKPDSPNISSAPVVISKKSYGMSLGGGLPGKTKTELKQELHDIKKLGFDQIRFDIFWDLVQPQKNSTYNWGSYDSILKEIRDQKLTAIVILNHTPQWARVSGCNYSVSCAPANAQSFAEFAAKAATHYKNAPIDAWEVWNEPNTSVFWKPKPDPVAYSTLLKLTYKQIKKVQPQATVLNGGLAGSTSDDGDQNIDPRTFLKAMYSNDTKESFDGLSYHPYTNLYLPDQLQEYNGWSRMYRLATSIRSIMTANGDVGKKVWITEMGVPNGGPGVEITQGAPSHDSSADHVSLDLQAQTASQSLSDIKDLSWVEDFVWDTYIDRNSMPITPENYYGIVDINKDPKPVYDIFKEYLSTH